MINTFINEYNTVNSTSKINNTTMLYKDSQITPFSINRTSIQNSCNKYIEEIKWGTGNKMAIAIGLNPSACLPYSLDKTNELLCRAIHSSE